MLFLRSLFGKYWTLYLAGVTVIVIVAATVLVQIFRSTNSPAQWFFTFISKWTVTSGAYDFVVEWAEALSITAAISVAVATIMRIREIRRERALVRIHNWARDAVVKLTRPSNGKSVTKKVADWKQRMRIIRAKSGGALTDARAFGNGLEPKINKAVKTLSEFEDCLFDNTESADVKNLLETTVSAFSEVINCTSHTPYYSH